MQIKIFDINEKITNLKEENLRFFYELKKFEDPNFLYQYLVASEFSNFKFPKDGEILIITVGDVPSSDEDKRFLDAKKDKGINLALKSSLAYRFVNNFNKN